MNCRARNSAKFRRRLEDQPRIGRRRRECRSRTADLNNLYALKPYIAVKNPDAKAGGKYASLCRFDPSALYSDRFSPFRVVVMPVLRT